MGKRHDEHCRLVAACKLTEVMSIIVEAGTSGVYMARLEGFGVCDVQT